MYEHEHYDHLFEQLKSQKKERFTIARKNTAIMVIDIQDKIAKAMYSEDLMKKNSKILIELANLFNLPLIMTEQNPDKLGPTNEVIKEAAKNAVKVGKMSFSAYLPEVKEVLEKNSIKNVVICGIETHICVFQTARELLANGYNVILANDALSSRVEENHKNALEMVKEMNGVVSNTETILFDLLGSAADPNFKQAQSLIK